MTTTVTLQLQDIQRLLLYGLTQLRLTRYGLCRIQQPDQFKVWLRSELAQGTIASAADDGRDARAGYQLFVAFTDPGLEHLGLSPRERSTFLPEFQQGMAAAHRARVIGDAPAGQGWLWGRPKESEVHVLCAVFASDPAALGSGAPPGCALVREVFAEHSDYEPFGFRDGLSQPYVVGSGRSDNHVPAHDRIAAGEFVLGYRNAFGVLPASPWTRTDSPLAREQQLLHAPLSSVYDLGLNGSYLVVRELRQNVQAFEQLTEHDRVRAIGRWQAGEPLVTHPVDAPASADPPGPDPTGNEFRYLPADAAGLRCPLGAHVRRANPRDALADDERGVSAEEAVRRANQHRILRRSRSFQRGDERGLFFMCFNSNIERQFEFVQQAWLVNPKFTGPRDETDPLMSPQRTSFTVRTGPERETLPQLGQFVQVLGGAYFFMPGVRVLSYLASLGSAADRQVG